MITELQEISCPLERKPAIPSPLDTIRQQASRPLDLIRARHENDNRRCSSGGTVRLGRCSGGAVRLGLRRGSAASSSRCGLLPPVGPAELRIGQKYKFVICRKRKIYLRRPMNPKSPAPKRASLQDLPGPVSFRPPLDCYLILDLLPSCLLPLFCLFQKLLIL